MKLYHGSPNKIEDSIKKKQARQAEGLNVPNDELLDAIYLTPDYGFALANAIKPKGLTNINEEEHLIEFENPNLFNPGKEVYVYEVDSEVIPAENLRKVDDLQYVVEGLDELKLIKEPTSHKAREILKYYKLINWKENKQGNMEFKMK